jgi:hypothetical protein
MLKLAALFAALTLLVAGCSQADDTADQAASSAKAEASRQAVDAAVQAKSKAAQEAVKAIQQAKKRASQGVSAAIRSQLCRFTEDGAISPSDLKALPSMLDAAATNGVSTDVTGPLRAAAARGRASAAEIRSTQRACKAGN